MAFGIDFSASPPDPALLKSKGVKFVGRYLSTPANPKNLTIGEATGLRANGIAIITFFETTANRALKGHAAGWDDAHSAQAQQFAVGLQDRPVYFAVDFDATPAQQAAINEYLAGASAAMGRDKVGVYGGYWVVKRALDAGVCKYACQTYAWSGGQWDSRAHLQQYKNGVPFCGISVDFERSMKRDFGQTPAPRPFVPLAVRRRLLRAWVLAQRAKGVTWTSLKRTAQWRKWRSLGGK